MRMVAKIPPVPWVGKTSRASSMLDFSLQCTATLHTRVVRTAMMKLWDVVTTSAQGVMATSPTTAPTAAPMPDGLRPRRQSKNIQHIMAVAPEVLVLRKALTAMPSAANPEPPLNPNHPSQRSAAPRMTKGMLAGRCCSVFALARRPRKRAPARAATPDDACTTMPPAKSWMLSHW